MPSPTILERYTKSLEKRPLLTKSVTAALLSGSSELLSSYLAGDGKTFELRLPVLNLKKTALTTSHTRLTKHEGPEQEEIQYRYDVYVEYKKITLKSYLSAKVPLMALYGFCVSAPISHYIYQVLFQVFGPAAPLSRRAPRLAKLLQIIASNLTVSTSLNTLFISYMTIISTPVSLDKAKSMLQKLIYLVRLYASKSGEALKKNLMRTLKLSWTTNPVALVVAQNLIDPALWVPFFSFFGFLLGTFNGYTVKRKLRDLREREEKQEKKD